MLTIKKIIKSYFLITGILVHLALFTGIYLVFYQYDIPYSYFATRLHDKITPYSYKLANIITPLPKKEAWKSPFPASLDWRGQGANPQYNPLKISYNDKGTPLAIQESTLTHHNIIHKAYNPAELLRLIKTVKPGEAIEVQPGIYHLDNKRIPINTIANNNNPITIYAKKLGEVFFKLNTVEGFQINAPFWSFQNLIIQGNCTNHTKCEHAFHIIGKSDSTIIRNNIISDFNAAIKGNGIALTNHIDAPDHVLIEHNSFTFSKPRNTSNPVTPIDVVNGDGWRIKANLISDFIKSAGDNISYAAFLKGESSNGIMEQNLVICSKNLDARQARQIGLSLGGGGTGNAFCSNRHCDFEHQNGIIRNNIIMNCNDVGIYIYKAKNTQIDNNTLYNTLGIDVRFKLSDAAINNNLLTGRIKSRDNATIIKNNNKENITDETFEDDWFQAPQIANFLTKNTSISHSIPDTMSNFQTDYCGNKRNKNSSIGAIDYSQNKSNNKSCKRLLANRLEPLDIDISKLNVMSTKKNTKPKVHNTKGKKTT